MEGDEVEMSQQELQKWIREKVKQQQLITPAVMEKCILLQELVERRERQAAHLLKLCESVAACEAVVRKQYALLGLEYRDTDSDDDDITGFGHTPPSPRESARSESHVCPSPANNGHTPLLPKLQDSENQKSDNGNKSFIRLTREPVVVLTRLPQSMITALCPPTAPTYCSEDQTDMQWEPDSDFSCSSFNTGSKKKRKIHSVSSRQFAKNRATTETTTKPEAKSNSAKNSSTPS